MEQYWADLSGRRNRVFVGGGEPLVKRLRSSFPGQGFSGPGVQGGGHRGDLFWAMCTQVRAFEKVRLSKPLVFLFVPRC